MVKQPATAGPASGRTPSGSSTRSVPRGMSSGAPMLYNRNRIAVRVPRVVPTWRGARTVSLASNCAPWCAPNRATAPVCTHPGGIRPDLVLFTVELGRTCDQPHTFQGWGLDTPGPVLRMTSGCLRVRAPGLSATHSRISRRSVTGLSSEAQPPTRSPAVRGALARCIKDVSVRCVRRPAGTCCPVWPRLHLTC